MLKERKAFELKTGVCYVPENGDQEYTYNDFLVIANNNHTLAQLIFDMCDWQHPETIVAQLIMDEEVDEKGNILN